MGLPFPIVGSLTPFGMLSFIGYPVVALVGYLVVEPVETSFSKPFSFKPLQFDILKNQLSPALEE
jgi:hypothetical protein